MHILRESWDGGQEDESATRALPSRHLVCARSQNASLTANLPRLVPYKSQEICKQRAIMHSPTPQKAPGFRLIQ